MNIFIYRTEKNLVVLEDSSLKTGSEEGLKTALTLFEVLGITSFKPTSRFLKEENPWNMHSAREITNSIVEVVMLSSIFFTTEELDMESKVAEE